MLMKMYGQPHSEPRKDLSTSSQIFFQGKDNYSPIAERSMKFFHHGIFPAMQQYRCRNILGLNKARFASDRDNLQLRKLMF
jgi:hypothetical protein